jgi:hypothetical protein
LDATAEYTATGYVTRYNNLQNVTINSTSYQQLVTLYDLQANPLTNELSFLVTFKDGNFLTVSGALVTVTKQYLSEGVYKTVEVPMTDNNGQVTAHLIPENALYTFVVTKNGVILGTWNSMTAVCQQLPCTINLNTLSSTTTSTDWTKSGGISYNVASNQAQKTITLTFISTDSSPKTVIFNSTLFDALGNTTVCQNTLTSTSGSLTCNVSNTFGNSTIKSNIYSNGVFVSTAITSFPQDPNSIFGTDGIVLLIIMYGMLPFFFIASPIGMVIAAMIAIIAAAFLNIYASGGLIGVGATAIWFIIAGIIIIWKMIVDLLSGLMMLY